MNRVGRRIIDELGLVVENENLVVFVPAIKKALIFRILSRRNRGYEHIPYGRIPLTAGTIVNNYDGGTTSVPADGILPARSYTSGLRITAPGDVAANIYEKADMWFLPKEERETLFHVIMKTAPEFVRIDCQIPMAVTQGAFQRKATVGVDKLWGYGRGKFETVHFPNIIYGYRYGNDTNIAVKVYLSFTYAEYYVKILKDPELIFDILTRRKKAHWLTLIAAIPSDIPDRLSDVYGIDGFKLYGIEEKEKAIEEYKEDVKMVK